MNISLDEENKLEYADNNQFLHLSAYIHRNQHEIPKWKGKEDKYPWSSLQDYVEVNRWPNLLAINHILKQFDNPEDYQIFMRVLRFGSKRIFLRV